MGDFLVLGVNGQDGSYLAEALLRRGYCVTGVGRNSESRYVPVQSRYSYRQIDLEDTKQLGCLLLEVMPRFSFHFAAVHGAVADGFSYETRFAEMMKVNLLSLHTLLEHARVAAPYMRIYYAGSAKVFPGPWLGVLNEKTPMQATCLYSVGKIAAYDLMSFYRSSHGVKSCHLIFFNHDSERRASCFFLPKIAEIIFGAQQSATYRGLVRTLDFWIDWSSADDLMDMVADVVGAEDCPALVMSSGKTIHARLGIAEAFAHYGLDVSAHLFEQIPPHDPGPAFEVDIKKLISLTGRRPTKTFFHIIDDIIRKRRDGSTREKPI